MLPLIHHSLGVHTSAILPAAHLPCMIFPSIPSVGVSHCELSYMSDLLLFTPPQQQSRPTGKPSQVWCFRLKLWFRDKSSAIWTHICLFNIYLYIHLFVMFMFLWKSSVQAGCSLPSSSLNMQCKATVWEPIGGCSSNPVDGLHVKQSVECVCVCVWVHRASCSHKLLHSLTFNLQSSTQTVIYTVYVLYMYIIFYWSPHGSCRIACSLSQGGQRSGSSSGVANRSCSCVDACCHSPKNHHRPDCRCYV